MDSDCQGALLADILCRLSRLSMGRTVEISRSLCFSRETFLHGKRKSSTFFRIHSPNSRPSRPVLRSDLSRKYACIVAQCYANAAIVVNKDSHRDTKSSETGSSFSLVEIVIVLVPMSNSACFPHKIRGSISLIDRPAVSQTPKSSTRVGSLRIMSRASLPREIRDLR